MGKGMPVGSVGGDEKLVRPRQRVAAHGEVFTPRWLVDDMLDLVEGETERIDSRFLKSACGSGNFLVPVLERKLADHEDRARPVQGEDASLSYTGIESHKGLRMYGLYDTVVAVDA